MALGIGACAHAITDAPTAEPPGSSSTRTAGVVHRIYATNAYPSPVSVTEYDFGASGDVKPVATIAGTHTGFLFGVGGLSVDSQGYLYVATSDVHGVGAILVFAPHAKGDAPPVRTLTASSYGGVFTVATALDSNDDLWLANLTTSAIEEFAPGAAGDVAPIRTISGSLTGLIRPDGIAIDRDGDIWVADEKAQRLVRFNAGASGDVAPKQIISGPATGLNSPFAIALSDTGDVWVSNISIIPPGKIYAFRSTDNGDVTPTQSIAPQPGQFVNGGPAFLNGKLVFPVLMPGNVSALDVYAVSNKQSPVFLRAIAGQDTGLASTGYVAVH